MALVILISVALSVIIAACFAIEALLKGQTQEKSCSLFEYSFYGGLIGGLIGTILGLIFGYIAASLTPYGDDLFLSGGIGQALVFMKVWLAFCMIFTISGAIYAGLRWRDKNFD